MKHSTAEILRNVAFIIKKTGTMFGVAWVAQLIEMIEKAIVPAGTFDLAKEVKHWQSYLFGMYGTDYPVFNGENRWECVEEPGVFFGESDLDGRPSPPFNYVGYAELKWRVTGLRMVRDVDISFEEPSNKLLVGGDRIFPEVAARREQYADRLPYSFLPASDLVDRGLPPEPPERIERHYYDKATRKHYRKKSVTGKYLVDTRSNTTWPFGPFVSPEGRIERDVILMTILPGIRGRVATLVNPGYGAGSKLGDLLTEGDILQSLFRACKDVGQADPWLQAVFTCSVKHDDETEEYGPLKLVPDSIVPLSRSGGGVLGA